MGEADIADGPNEVASYSDSEYVGSPGHAFGGPKDIEWVDWLDEYRKLKDAKIKEQEDPPTSESTTQAQADAKAMPPPPPPIHSDKGKARAIDAGRYFWITLN